MSTVFEPRSNIDMTSYLCRYRFTCVLLPESIKGEAYNAFNSKFVYACCFVNSTATELPRECATRCLTCGFDLNAFYIDLRFLLNEKVI